MDRDRPGARDEPPACVAAERRADEPEDRLHRGPPRAGAPRCPSSAGRARGFSRPRRGARPVPRPRRRCRRAARLAEHAIDPTSARPRIAIIGSGFSGLCLAIQLRRPASGSFTIFEKADRVGGTWRDNTYPGAACDSPSFAYCFSFEQKTDWSRKWAPQPEILAYIEHCARKYGLLPHIRFGTRDRRGALRRAPQRLAPAHARGRGDRGRGARERHRASSTARTRPRSPGSTRFRGVALPLGALGPRRRARRQGRRRDRQRRERDPVRSRDRAARSRQPRRLPAQRQLDDAASATAPTASARSARFARWPWLARLYRWWIWLAFELRWPVFRQQRVHEPAAARSSRASTCATASATRRCSRRCPRLSGRRQAHPDLRRLLPGARARRTSSSSPTPIERVDARRRRHARRRRTPRRRPDPRDRLRDDGVPRADADRGRRRAAPRRRWKQGARGLPRHLGRRLPEPLPDVRAQHEPRTQLDHLHDRVPDRATSSTACAQMRERGLAWIDVRREAMRGLQREAAARARRAPSGPRTDQSWYKTTPRPHHQQLVGLDAPLLVETRRADLRVYDAVSSAR